MRLYGNLTEETTEKMRHEFHRHFSLIDGIYVLLAKLVPSRWLDVDRVLFAFQWQNKREKSVANALGPNFTISQYKLGFR